MVLGNALALNVEKTNIMKFTASYHQNEVFQIIYKKKDNNWKKQHKISRTRTWQKYKLEKPCPKITPKLSRACYLVRGMYPCCCTSNILKMIYFPYFHPVMDYGTMFWGGAVESKRIFQHQKRIIGTLTGSTDRIYWQDLLHRSHVDHCSGNWKYWH